jgi:nucleoside-diphosphate-sugar epimerase
VVGLARSDAAAATIAAAGAAVVRGDLDDPAGLAAAAAASDGVVHLAFQHDVAFAAGDFPAAAAADRRAVEAMGSALAGSDRPFVLASGLFGLVDGRVATEHDGLAIAPAMRANPAGIRGETALLALSLRGIGVRSSVLRLPPTVHGAGDRGFVATFATIARDRGVSAYVGEGTNRWPAVHVRDAARLARLAAERAPAGSVVHAVGDEGVPFRAIAEAIGARLGVPVTSVAPADAAAHFGHLGPLAAIDGPASAALTRELLDWAPAGPSLLDDIAAGHYDR